MAQQFTSNKENEIYPGSGFHPDVSMQAMNLPSRQMPQNRFFAQSSGGSQSQGGNRYTNFFQPPNAGTFVQGGQRYNSQIVMPSPCNVPGYAGYNKMPSHHMNAVMPNAENQGAWRDTQYPPRNVLTENTQLMNVANYSQRQSPNLMSFEASSSQKMATSKPSATDTASKTAAKFTPSASPDNKKKPINLDFYEQFNMIGSVEQVICWNQMAKGKKCFITYEVHGFLESVSEESPSVSVLWIKQDPHNGLVIQGVYCNIDRRLSDKLQPGNYVVCYGRMLKTKIMQIFNAVVDTTRDVGIKRISFLCQRSLQEFINRENSSI
ncbi:uncharacterized protein LOC111063351 isoform X2 [Nilaparvata lugens]|uniref:uncharacterized protein LOC111063351 isoform X2 n=1 Tax=Nilaparvata lugens TaxID=108931 RepID=UPI00193DA433|nr:uncharacterized protein LOC111063351 isoform X2 [Nilaparvata lugens]